MTKDLTGRIIDFECEELSFEKTVELFSELIKNGMAWTLQGFYGRTARALIEEGYLNYEGDILEV